MTREGKNDAMTVRKITIKGKIGSKVDGDRVEYVAAVSPDSMSSFSGSGLPFPNPQQAFSGTTNRGHFNVDADNEFELTVDEPNSYYTGLGKTLVEPSLFVRYGVDGKQVTERLVIGRPIAYRTLTYPTGGPDGLAARSSCEFYRMATDVDARTQEKILRDSEYTGLYEAKFWGTTPPN